MYTAGTRLKIKDIFSASLWDARRDSLVGEAVTLTQHAYPSLVAKGYLTAHMRCDTKYGGREICINGVQFEPLHDPEELAAWTAYDLEDGT